MNKELFKALIAMNVAGMIMALTIAAEATGRGKLEDRVKIIEEQIANMNRKEDAE